MAGDHTEAGRKRLMLKPILQERVQFTIVGTSPMIQHKWSQKAIDMILEKKTQGKKTRDRDRSIPEEEADAAAYKTVTGKHGIPVTALKAAIIGAAHKDIGIEKTLVRKALFIECPDANGVLPMKCDKPTTRTDPVRVGQGSADLRFRPMFVNWSVRISAVIDAELLQLQDVMVLVDRAGFGVGICEWRPEKGGEYGRFKVDRSQDIDCLEIPED